MKEEIEHFAVSDMKDCAKAEDGERCLRNLHYSLRGCSGEHKPEKEKWLGLIKIKHDIGVLCIANEKQFLQELFSDQEVNPNAFEERYVTQAKGFYDTNEKIQKTKIELSDRRLLEGIDEEVNKFSETLARERHKNLLTAITLNDLSGNGTIWHDVTDPIRDEVRIESKYFGFPVRGRVDIVEKIDANTYKIREIKVNKPNYRFEKYDELQAGLYGFMFDIEKKFGENQRIEVRLDYLIPSESREVNYKTVGEKGIELVKKLKEIAFNNPKNIPTNKEHCQSCYHKEVCECGRK